MPVGKVSNATARATPPPRREEQDLEAGRRIAAVGDRAVEIGIQSAYVDEAPLAAVGLEGNSRNALQGFRRVDVRQLDDLTQRLYVNDVRRLHLLGDGVGAIDGRARNRLLGAILALACTECSRGFDVGLAGRCRRGRGRGRCLRLP